MVKTRMWMQFFCQDCGLVHEVYDLVDVDENLGEDELREALYFQGHPSECEECECETFTLELYHEAND